MHRSVFMKCCCFFFLKTYDGRFVAPWSVHQEREAVCGSRSRFLGGDGHLGIVLGYCVGLVPSHLSSGKELRDFHR